MTPIGHIHMDRDILVRKDLSATERMLLALVVGFGDNGLGVSNVELAEILCIHEKSISRLLQGLEDKKTIRIEDPKSRNRRIYSGVEVESKSAQMLPSRKTKSAPRLSKSAQGLLEVRAGVTQKRNKRIGEESPSGITFDDFWKSYPKRKAKGDARKAWAKLKPAGELLEKIIAGAKDVARRAEAGEFAGPLGRLQWCKNPATWLNAEGWADESEEPEYSTRDITEEEADELLREVS